MFLEWEGNTIIDNESENMISVIIPVYNVEKYVERCLESLQGQNYKDFEVICVNDGSTDRSMQVIKKWASGSKLNITVVNIPNQGVSVARNIGIGYAKGDYLCFIDADDMVSPNYLRFLWNAFQKKQDCQIALCKRKLVGDDFELDSVSKDEYVFKAEPSIEYYDSLSILEQMLYHKLSFGIWNVMVTKNFIERHSFRFAEGYAYSEDLEMVWRLVAKSDIVAVIDRELYIYRARNGSAMAIFDQRREDGYKLFLKLEKFLCENRTDFAPEFSEFGVAYWMWSTLWQAVKGTNSYTEFGNVIQFMDLKRYLPNLKRYPSILVRWSTGLFLLAPKWYYILVKVYLSLKK